MYYRIILLYKQTIKKGGPNLNNFITDMHEPCLQLVGFKESAVPKSFNPVGNFYELNDNCGKGFYWVYGNSNKYTITLQECTMFDEYELQYTPPKYMGINYYCSAAKIEKSPYKAISNNELHGFYSTGSQYTAVYQKDIPLRVIGLEINPDYFQDICSKYTKIQLPSPSEICQAIHQLTDYSDIILILNQIKNFMGDIDFARAYYDSKILELMTSILVKITNPKGSRPKICPSDKIALNILETYINNNLDKELRIDTLAQISYMSRNKLQTCFKDYFGYTIMDYIRIKRLQNAQLLLESTELDVKEIALLCGYRNSSRFSKLFYIQTNMLPRQYRNYIKKWRYL